MLHKHSKIHISLANCSILISFVFLSEVTWSFMCRACSITFVMEFFAEKWGEGTLLFLELFHMYFVNVTAHVFSLSFLECSVVYLPRTTEVGCESDMEFLAKVHCVRKASEVCKHSWLFIHLFTCSILNAFKCFIVLETFGFHQLLYRIGSSWIYSHTSRGFNFANLVMPSCMTMTKFMCISVIFISHVEIVST